MLISFLSFQVHIKDFLGFTSGKLWFEKQVFKIIFPTYILFWDAAVMIKISEIYIVLFFSKIYQAFFYDFLWIYFTTMMCVKHKIEPIHSRDKHIITKKIFGMVIHYYNYEQLIIIQLLLISFNCLSIITPKNI